MIFNRYKKPVFNFAFRMLGNRADAEDATSDVFLVLFGKKYQSQPHAKFSTWIFTVTRNTCIDKLRKQKNIFSFWVRNDDTNELEEFDVPDPQPHALEKLHTTERLERVNKALDKLPLAQKEALVLREYHDLSYDEIAAVLRCSVAKVKVLIFRARQNLKERIPSMLLKEDNHDES